MKDQHCI